MFFNRKKIEKPALSSDYKMLSRIYLSYDAQEKYITDGAKSFNENVQSAILRVKDTTDFQHDLGLKLLKDYGELFDTLIDLTLEYSEDNITHAIRLNR